jgi:hypothetical protein
LLPLLYPLYLVSFSFIDALLASSLSHDWRFSFQLGCLDQKIMRVLVQRDHLKRDPSGLCVREGEDCAFCQIIPTCMVYKFVSFLTSLSWLSDMCFLYVISFLNAPFVLFVQAKFDFDNSLRSLECDNIKVHMTAAYSFVFLSSIDDFTSHPSQSLVDFIFHTLSLQLVKSPTGLGHLPFSAVWCLLLPGEPQTKDLKVQTLQPFQSKKKKVFAKIFFRK